LLTIVNCPKSFEPLHLQTLVSKYYSIFYRDYPDAGKEKTALFSRKPKTNQGVFQDKYIIKKSKYN